MTALDAPLGPFGGLSDEVPGPATKRGAQIARALEDEIIARGWPVGELLGSETELRERFGVSRSVLREAMRLLEHHQVARMRRGPGGGLLVAAPDAGPATRALVIYLEYAGSTITDLLHARQLLEPLAARAAAATITEQGIEQLRAALEAEVDSLDRPDLERADELFHRQLSRLSGNPVLHLFIEVLNRLTFRFATTSVQAPAAAVARVKAINHASHAEIADAVIAGDVATAETRQTEHLRQVQGWLQDQAARGGHPVGTAPADPGAPRKRAEVTAERILADIAAAGWPAGEVVGSEAELLARYGVSRAVLREAVRLLEHHSVARMRRGPGGGLVVQTPDPAASIHTIALYLSHQGFGLRDLWVVREAVELGCLRLLTEAGVDPAGISRLRELADRSAEDGGTAGAAFHDELAAQAGNPVLALFLRITSEVWPRRRPGSAGPPPATPEGISDDHRRIVDAVAGGDPVLARHRMRRHLQDIAAWAT